MKDFPPDPLEPPELWADDPKIWATTRTVPQPLYDWDWQFAFFALPYRSRRAALDKSYGTKPSATSTSDIVVLILTVALSALLLWHGVEAVSFLGGLWIGATLIQLYFHRFHEPVPPDRAAPPETSPLKEMSYAIQASPWRPWPQMAVLAILVVWSLILIVR